MQVPDPDHAYVDSRRLIMKAVLRALSLALALVFVAGSLAGCNTVRGMGKDIQAGGKAVERVAQ